ncbi:hypothetical protein D3C81_1839300 [compost metagenome]
MPDQLPAVGAVNPGRLEQGGIQAHNGGQINNAGIARILPHCRQHHGCPAVILFRQKVDRGQTEPLPQLVDQPAVRGQHENPDARHHDPGEQMGQIHDHLRQLLEPDAANLV